MVPLVRRVRRWMTGISVAHALYCSVISFNHPAVLCACMHKYNGPQPRLLQIFAVGHRLTPICRQAIILGTLSVTEKALVAHGACRQNIRGTALVAGVGKPELTGQAGRTEHVSP